MRMSIKAALVLAAMAPLLTTGIATDYVQGQATKSKGGEARGVVPPDSFGSATASIVCGDQLCSEVRDLDGADNMMFKVIDVYPLSGSAQKVLIRVTAPANDFVRNEMLTVTSNIDSSKVLVPYVDVNSRDYVSTIILADNPRNISVHHAEKVTDDGKPRAEVLDVSPLGFKAAENTYRVTFEVIAGSESLNTISVNVQSDTESFTTNISGMFGFSTQTQQMLIKASNPNSISVSVENYQAST